MAEITYNYENFIANVKPFRGYDDFIRSITVYLSATDGVNTIRTGATLELDVMREFTEDNPYVPFEQWTQEKVLSVVDPLVESRGIKNALNLKLKVKSKLPQSRQFNF